ncbi:MAG: hypothetical protein FWF24_03315 [Alphaproteobacteria bacterium]|nr:hypothetical protein [Alphaproteobacteria bacterium]
MKKTSSSAMTNRVAVMTRVHSFALAINNNLNEYRFHESLISALSNNGPGLEENIRSLTREGLLKTATFGRTKEILSAAFKVQPDLKPFIINEVEKLDEGFKKAATALHRLKENPFSPNIHTLIMDTFDPKIKKFSPMARQHLQSAYTEDRSPIKTRDSVLRQLEAQEKVFCENARLLAPIL